MGITTSDFAYCLAEIHNQGHPMKRLNLVAAIILISLTVQLVDGPVFIYFQLQVCEKFCFQADEYL